MLAKNCIDRIRPIVTSPSEFKASKKKQEAYLEDLKKESVVALSIELKLLQSVFY